MLVGSWDDQFGLSPNPPIANLYLEIDTVYQVYTHQPPHRLKPTTIDMLED